MSERYLISAPSQKWTWTANQSWPPKKSTLLQDDCQRIAAGCSRASVQRLSAVTVNIVNMLLSDRPKVSIIHSVPGTQTVICDWQDLKPIIVEAGESETKLENPILWFSHWPCISLGTLVFFFNTNWIGSTPKCYMLAILLTCKQTNKPAENITNLAEVQKKGHYHKHLWAGNVG